MIRSDDQRRAMFASMGNNFARARTAKPIKEDFALVGNALAYRGDIDVTGDQEYEVFVPNIFAQNIKELEDLSRYRGTDLAKVASDVLKLRREQSKPISEQEYIDVSTLPSLQDIGYDKAFEYEVFETVSDGLPEGEFEDWGDITEYQKSAFEKAKDWRPTDVEEPNVIIKEKIIEREVPVSEMGDLIYDQPEDIGSYFRRSGHKTHLGMAGEDIPDVPEFEHGRTYYPETVVEEQTVYPDVDFGMTTVEMEAIASAEAAGVSKEQFLDNVGVFEREKTRKAHDAAAGVAYDRRLGRDRADLQSKLEELPDKDVGDSDV